MTDQRKATPATREQAEQVLKLVEKKYAGWLKTFAMNGNKIDFDAPLVDVPDTDRPKVFMNWGDDNETVIAWENNSPCDWALSPLDEDQIEPEFGSRIPGVDIPAAQRKIYTDAWMSFVLAVYQED